MSRPSVDVAIPCYNYAHYLERCVETVLSQRDVDVRVLIIDDQSPDNTEEVGRALASRDQRVFYTKNERNLGLVGTSNVGVIDWAEAEYTLLLSADDLLVPGALSRATTALERVPEAAFVFGPALIFADDSQIDPAMPDPPKAHVDVIEGAELVRHFCRRANGIPTPTAVVRTSMQKAAGPYNNDVKFACDMEMWIRLAALGPVLALDTIQGCYRWHANNMSNVYTEEVSRYWRENIAALEAGNAACADKMPELPKLLVDFRKRTAQTLCWRGSVAALAGDLELADAHLQAAAEIYPDIVGSGSWWKARLKYRLGNPVGRALLSLTGMKVHYTPSDIRSITAPEIHVEGEPWRWWPEEAAAR